MIYISKRTLATLYANLVGAVVGGYDMADKGRRKAAYIQLTKKENAETVDKDKMQQAFDQYAANQKAEFEIYLKGLK